MEQLDPDSQQIQEVYARYGLAIYQAQCIERLLAIILVTEYGPGPNKITPQEYDELLESYFNRTLGGLIRKFLAEPSIPEDLEDRLKKALDARNFLAHRYFWDRAVKFASSQGRSKMLFELQRQIDFFDELDADLTKMFENWAGRNGITPDRIDQIIQRLLKSEHNET